MQDDQIKHMVNRFLGWRLPENFSPDGGISFKPTFNEHTAHPMRHEPSGTNLFDATQAEAMVRYLVEGLPVGEKAEPNPEWEAKAEAYHAEAVAEGGANPFDTLTMLKRWKADAEPANALGQVSFSRALLDSATDGLQAALEMARQEHLRAERAIRSLKVLQDGADVAMASLLSEGIVADFLAAIHREAVRGQLASDDVTNEAEAQPA